MKKKCIHLLLILLAFCSCEDNNVPPLMNLEIGQFHQGGVIFYIDESGQHGLVAAENDLGDNLPWGCMGTFYNITELRIGAGNQNTLDILAKINQDNFCNPEIYAAKLCNELIIEQYSDWFLPSYEELNLMHERRELLGGFNDWFYWSSTEQDINWVRIKYFGPDSDDFAIFNNGGREGPYNVRAIREF